MTTGGARALQRSDSEVLCSPDTRAFARGHALLFFSVTVKKMDEKVPEASSSHSHTQPTCHFSHTTKHCATPASKAEGRQRSAGDPAVGDPLAQQQTLLLLHEGEVLPFPSEACFLHN